MRTNLVKRAQGKPTKRFSNGGFTLMELIIGATLTTTVIGAAGYGVASMISTSTALNSRTEKRTALSRSSDFIATEIRRNDKLRTGSLSGVNPTGFDTSYTGKVSGTVTKVLAIDPTPGSTTPIIYFVATPTTGSWRGPRALFRWGPAFNNDGTYSSTAPSSTAPWVSEVVVDQIQSASAGTAPSCPTTLNGDFGFSACVDSLGKSAKIFQNGKINKVLGYSDENYGLNMNAGLRKTTVATTTASLAGGGTALAPWTLNNGVVTINSSLSIGVRYIGGSITCGAGGVSIPTQGTLILQAGSGTPTTTSLNMTAGSTTPVLNTVVSNTTLTVQGHAGGNGLCSNFSSANILSTDINNQSTTANNDGHVISLKKGDPVPGIEGFGGQQSISEYLTGAGYVNTANNTIKIGKNDVIYLFELGGGTYGDRPFDLQDMVVLVTLQ